MNKSSWHESPVWQGIHYTKALTPDQIPKMRLFLQNLTRDADTMQGNGQQIDITKYIKEWRGYKSSRDVRNQASRRYWARRGEV